MAAGDTYVEAGQYNITSFEVEIATGACFPCDALSASDQMLPQLGTIENAQRKDEPLCTAPHLTIYRFFRR